MTHSMLIPVCGELHPPTEVALGDSGAGHPLAARIGRRPADAFGTLVGLYQENERILSQLRSLRQQAENARDYRLSSGCNLALADARLRQLRDRRSSLLTRLRSNRIAAVAHFGGPDRDAA